MNYSYDSSAPKKATNLSVNSDLLAQARELGINLSAHFESTLAAKVKELKAEAWLQENQNAIAAYNQDVQRHGTFGEASRLF